MPRSGDFSSSPNTWGLVPPVTETVSMTGTVSAAQQQAADGSTGLAQSRARRLPGRGWIVAGLVALTALGLTLAYSLWWSKPTTFTSVGNGLGFKQTTETMHPVTVDMVQRSVHAVTETITMTVAPQPHGRVVIEGMEVDYTRDSDHLWQRGSQATGPVVKVQVSK